MIKLTLTNDVPLIVPDTIYYLKHDQGSIILVNHTECIVKESIYEVSRKLRESRKKGNR